MMKFGGTQTSPELFLLSRVPAIAENSARVGLSVMGCAAGGESGSSGSGVVVRWSLIRRGHV